VITSGCPASHLFDSKFKGVYDTFEKLAFPAYSVLLILWKFEETKVEPMHSLWQVSYIQ